MREKKGFFDKMLDKKISEMSALSDEEFLDRSHKYLVSSFIEVGLGVIISILMLVTLTIIIKL